MPDHRDEMGIERPPGDERPAEQWARGVFEGAPRPLQILLRIGWRCLGLHGRLAPQNVPG